MQIGGQNILSDGRCVALQRKNIEWNKDTAGSYSCDFFSELNCEGSSSLFEEKGDHKFNFVPRSVQCYQCTDIVDIGKRYFKIRSHRNDVSSSF